jgi:type IV fimbrial biogenesis protein FimT
MRSPGHPRRRCGEGFTLVEALIAVVVLATLVILAVPSLRGALQNVRATVQANHFVATLNFARTEAVKRRTTVRVCTSANGTSCRSSSDADKNNWHKGWLVMANPTTPTVLRSVTTLDTGYTLTSSISSIDFAASGASLNGTPSYSLLAPGCSGDNNRTIRINVSGRVSVTRSAC